MAFQCDTCTNLHLQRFPSDHYGIKAFFDFEDYSTTTVSDFDVVQQFLEQKGALESREHASAQQDAFETVKKMLTPLFAQHNVSNETRIRYRAHHHITRNPGSCIWLDRSAWEWQVLVVTWTSLVSVTWKENRFPWLQNRHWKRLPT